LADRKKNPTIRSLVWDPLAMTKDPKGLRAVLHEVGQSSERSTLFWWLVEHHRELKAGSMGRRLKWEKLSALFNELGLTDINGNPAKPNTARQTWLRARRFVADEERRLAAARRPWATYPSRMPKDFRPAAIPNGNGPPEQSVPVRPPPAVGPEPRPREPRGEMPPPQAGPEPGAETVQKALSALDKTDGYLNLFQPKRNR
jgi:hypothetical protein